MGVRQLPDKVCTYTTAENCRTRTLKNVVYDEALITKSRDYGHTQVPAVPNFPHTDSHPTDVRDDDILFDPRCHLSADDTLDVPYHGYIFDASTDVNWDGTIPPEDERMFDLSNRDITQAIDDMVCYSSSDGD